MFIINQFRMHETTAWLYCTISINRRIYFWIYLKTNSMKWPNPIWMWNFYAWIQRYCYHQLEPHWLALVSHDDCHVVKWKKHDEPFVFISCYDDCVRRWIMMKKLFCRLPTIALALMSIIFWIWVRFAHLSPDKKNSPIFEPNFHFAFIFQTTAIWLRALFYSKMAQNIADFWLLKRYSWFWWSRIRSVWDGAVSFRRQVETNDF